MPKVKDYVGKEWADFVVVRVLPDGDGFEATHTTDKKWSETFHWDDTDWKRPSEEGEASAAAAASAPPAAAAPAASPPARGKAAAKQPRSASSVEA